MLDVPLGTQYLLLGSFLVIGLAVYERFHLRLGGVLVVPLLALYVLLEPVALPIFLVAGAASWTAGALLHRRTLLYGRQLFIAMLLVSLVATYATMQFVGTTVAGLLLPILPGVFAYNLHREKLPLRGLAATAGVLVACIGGALVMTALFTPDPAMASTVDAASALAASGAAAGAGGAE